MPNVPPFDTPREEQQGEPVCSCIDVWIDVGPSCPVHRGQIPGREREPFAPPSSEEAEAQWRKEAWWGGLSVWRDAVFGKSVAVPDTLADAIRSPLEERIRELEARPGGWYEAGHDDAVAALEPEIKALEEERDRLREALDNAGAALPEMLEMASNGEFLTGLWAQRLLDSHRRAEAAEAQVAKLREAAQEAFKDIKDGWKDSAATVLRRALAETVQEGGETQ